MGRTWPGGTSTAHLTIPNTTAFDFNTNVCIMAIVNPTNFTNQHMLAIMGIANPGSSLQTSNVGGNIIFTKHPVINLQAADQLLTNEWQAVMAVSSSGGNASFKRYRYATSILTTETVTDSTTYSAPSNTGGRFGNNNPTADTTASWAGQIDRVLIGQGIPSDAEFTAWARAGTIPPSLTVKGYWILSPSGTATDPEVDLGPNGLNITGGNIVGTTASAAFVLPDAGLTPTVAGVVESLRIDTSNPMTFSVSGAMTDAPKGALIGIMHGTSSTDHVTGVTYGGVALTRAQRNVDTATEPGAAEWWFRGNGIPTGTQTVSIALASGTTDDIHAVCILLNANADLEVVDVDGLSDTNAANPSRTLQYSGRQCMAFAAFYSGLTAISSITAGANCQLITTSELAGNFCSVAIRQTTPGTSDFTIAATAAADDVAFAAVAIGEVLANVGALGAWRSLPPMLNRPSPRAVAF